MADTQEDCRRMRHEAEHGVTLTPDQEFDREVDGWHAKLNKPESWCVQGIIDEAIEDGYVMEDARRVAVIQWLAGQVELPPKVRTR